MTSGPTSLRIKKFFCPVLVLLFACGLPLAVGRAPWPMPIRVWLPGISPWNSGNVHSVFVVRVVRVNGWINRTVTLDVTEVLKGSLKVGSRLEVEPGEIAGTDAVGRRILAYVPNMENLTAGWRSEPIVLNDYQKPAAVLLGRRFIKGESPFGIELAETDAPLDLRDLQSPTPKPIPRRLIQYQRDVLTVQAMKAPLTPEQVRILEDWLKPEFRYEAPGPWLIRDLLKPIAQEDQEAARLLEEYEELPW